MSSSSQGCYALLLTLIAIFGAIATAQSQDPKADRTPADASKGDKAPDPAKDAPKPTGTPPKPATPSATAPAASATGTAKPESPPKFESTLRDVVLKNYEALKVL